MRPTPVRLPCDLGLKSVAPYFTGNRELGTGNGTNPRNNSTTRELENDEVTRQLDNSTTRELPKIYICDRSPSDTFQDDGCGGKSISMLEAFAALPSRRSSFFHVIGTPA